MSIEPMQRAAFVERELADVCGTAIDPTPHAQRASPPHLGKD